MKSIILLIAIFILFGCTQNQDEVERTIHWIEEPATIVLEISVSNPQLVNNLFMMVGGMNIGESLIHSINTTLLNKDILNTVVIDDYSYDGVLKRKVYRRDESKWKEISSYERKGSTMPEYLIKMKMKTDKFNVDNVEMVLFGPTLANNFANKQLIAYSGNTTHRDLFNVITNKFREFVYGLIKNWAKMHGIVDINLGIRKMESPIKKYEKYKMIRKMCIKDFQEWKGLTPTGYLDIPTSKAILLNDPNSTDEYFKCDIVSATN